MNFEFYKNHCYLATIIYLQSSGGGVITVPAALRLGRRGPPTVLLRAPSRALKVYHKSISNLVLQSRIKRDTKEMKMQSLCFLGLLLMFMSASLALLHTTRCIKLDRIKRLFAPPLFLCIHVSFLQQ
ncbi:hypothetical protein VPH35_066747 [Triticum aestivum]